MKLLRLRWRSLRIVAAVGVIAAVLSAGAFVVQEGQELREQVLSGETTIAALRERAQSNEATIKALREQVLSGVATTEALREQVLSDETTTEALQEQVLSDETTIAALRERAQSNEALIAKLRAAFIQVPITQCDPEATSAMNFALGLDPVGYEHRFDAGAFVAARAPNAEIVSLGVDYGKVGALRYGPALDIVPAEESDATWVISAKPDDATFAVDLLLYVSPSPPSAARGICTFPLRVHFAEPMAASATGYEIVSVMGRHGNERGTFNLPYGSKFDRNGIFWITDCTNNSLSTFSPAGEFLGGISGYGTQIGRLHTPAGLELHGDRIYVVEERNHRVSIFGTRGRWLTSFGAYKDLQGEVTGEWPDKFNNPLGIAVSDDAVVVTDYGNNRLTAFDHALRPLWVSGNTDDDPFTWYSPYSVEYVAAHDVFAATNRSNHEVGLVSPAGEKLRVIGAGILNRPHELAADHHGNLYVADTNNHRIAIFSAGSDYADVSFVQFPESYGLPKTVAVDTDGTLAVGFLGNALGYVLVLRKTTAPDTWMAAMPRLFPYDPRSVPLPSLTDPTVQTATTIYEQFCSVCHESGRYDAPVRGNEESWARFPRDREKLLALAITGNGAMIPRGGCIECSDDALRGVIEYMLPVAWRDR